MYPFSKGFPRPREAALPLRQAASSPRLTNELRSVIASDTRRSSTPTGDSGHNPPNFGSGDRRRCVQHQALTSIFVHQRQPLERAAIGRPIVDEVAGPNIVLELGRLIDAAIRAGLRGPSFLVFRSLTGRFSPSEIQSLRTRLILIVQPRRNSRAWIIRYPKRGCRRASRLISRFKAGSSERCV